MSRKERVVSPTKALEEKVISGGRSLVEKWLSLSGNEERSGETSGKIVLALATHRLHKHTNIVDWPIDFKANLTLRKYDHFEHKHLF